MRSAVARLCDTNARKEIHASALNSTNGDFASLAQSRLLWLPDLGIGYLDEPPAENFYGAAYFEHYRKLDKTSAGAALTRARLDMVRRHHATQRVVDVGIGGGRFILEHGNACGWDVNPEAIRWLHESGLLCDPRAGADAVTMWDSMEHMANPSEILESVREWVFVSTPIYRDGDDALCSKHYKPGEHLWYFTEHGLVTFMRRHGFAVCEANRMECDLGRESIGSYAFCRMR